MSTSVAPGPTGSQLATAFDGKLEPKRLSLLYHLGLVVSAVVMVLLPLVYFATVAGVAWAVWWHATHDAWWVTGFGRVGRVTIFIAILYAAPIVAGVILVIFLLAPLWPQRRSERKPYWVDRREQPMLYAYIDRLCDAMRAPKPARINLVADGNAWVHIDNGLAGLVRRRLALTIGLPLVASMDLRGFTGVVAHELGHFSQGGMMRLSSIVHGINGWLVRLAWAPSRTDRLLHEWTYGDTHWSMMLIAAIAKLGLFFARLLFKALATVGHAVNRNLSRQAEFDADYAAARVVGTAAANRTLAELPYIGTACELALGTAEQGWAKRQLPDDLVELAERYRQNMPKDVRSKIEASILSQSTSWFDSHPPLFKRMAALKKANLRGVLTLDAPATCVFKDFDELCKFVTIDTYQSILGPHLEPEHLVPVPA